MQAENKEIKTVHPEKGMYGRDDSGGSKTNARDSPVVAGGEGWSSDSFYEKLSKFYESSGLSLVFNFRETNTDLYQFYKDVTERGGFHQVTTDGKWGEVASALSSRSRISMSTTQLQKLYANLLYQFEQTYYYCTPSKPTQPPGQLSSIGKRKHCDGSSDLRTVHSGTRDSPLGKAECANSFGQLSTEARTEEKKLPLQKPSKVKEMRKDRDAPVGLRSAYQIFLKMECDRLKKIHGESSGGLIRDVAIKTWGVLPNKDRQPYFEASKNDRDRYNREMAEYKERKSKQITKIQSLATNTKPTILNFARPSQGDGDYHVTLETNAENVQVSDKSLVELATGLMKNARPNDPILQMNWDDYCGTLDIPS
ncbi:hypothetical protein LguiB_021554 [Lonicera macranthoides]